MAKKVTGYLKLQVPAGAANPSPPIGPALGQRGLNIMEFCKAFNAQTQGMEPGLPIPVVITAFADKSFTFIMKTPPATVLIKKGYATDLANKAAWVALDTWNHIKCPACSGRGVMNIEQARCPACNGTGERDKACLPEIVRDGIGALMEAERWMEGQLSAKLKR
jgi:hypothetical protein